MRSLILLWEKLFFTRGKLPNCKIWFARWKKCFSKHFTFPKRFLCILLGLLKKHFHSTLCNNFPCIAEKHLIWNYFCLQLKSNSWLCTLNHTPQVHHSMIESESCKPAGFLDVPKRRHEDLRNTEACQSGQRTGCSHRAFHSFLPVSWNVTHLSVYSKYSLNKPSKRDYVYITHVYTQPCFEWLTTTS